jgi:hypothetical protein
LVAGRHNFFSRRAVAVPVPVLVILILEFRIR